MARPHSVDLRQRIVSAVEGGLSRRAAAARFAVTQSCAIKLMQRWADTGSVARRVKNLKRPRNQAAPLGRIAVPETVLTEYSIRATPAITTNAEHICR